MLGQIPSELYRSIHRQPEIVRSVLAQSVGSIDAAVELLAPCERIYTVGTGTSGHAATVAAFLLEAVGVPAQPLSSFDFANYPPRLGPQDGVLAISHSGTNRYGLRAIETAVAARVPLVGVTGRESPMAGPGVVVRTTPPETSSTHTQSYTGNLAAIALLACGLGSRRGQDLGSLPTDLAAVPAHMESILRREDEIVPTADRLAAIGRLVLAGAGPNAATAREGALKVKESSYLVAEGFELEMILHGGLQPLRSGDVSVAVVVRGPAVPRAEDILRTWKIVGTQTLLVADAEVVRRLRAHPDLGPFDTLEVPTVAEPLSPILTVLPLQLLAAATAQRRGTNADTFRRDDPVFARAIASYEF